MWPVVHDLSISGLQADAPLRVEPAALRCTERRRGPAGGRPSHPRVRLHGLCRAGGAGIGDHPETAVIRMRSARAAAGAAFAESALQCRPRAISDWLHAARPRLPADQVAGGSSGTGQRDRAVFLAGRAVP
jgi:hypothetical protein